MTILHCYVDDQTLSLLSAYSAQDGRSVEQLAEDAISEAALQTKRENLIAAAVAAQPFI